MRKSRRIIWLKRYNTAHDGGRNYGLLTVNFDNFNLCANLCGSYSIVYSSLPIIGLLTYTKGLMDLTHGLNLADQGFGFLVLADDLIGGIAFSGHKTSLQGLI